MRGPRLEQIDGGDPTFRVEVESRTGKRMIAPGCELMQSHEATAAARLLARNILAATSDVRHVHVVNERTGFTRDTISWEPIAAALPGEGESNG
jgi:hypothetical protein